jgi:hypothetical protein
MGLQNISYISFVVNDIILALIIIGLFTYICIDLVKYISAKKTGSTVRPINYINSILKK